MKRKKLAQIVITRTDENKFKVLLFDKKECVDDEAYDEAATAKLVAKALKRLRAVGGL